MNFIISGKNIEVTPGLKEAIEQKLGKLERYFTPETEIIVTLSVEKGTSENRSDDSCKRIYHPLRADEQRHVCVESTL